ncbi:ABC transporter substrate-binding protein [Paenibacillus alginolyticus]|uniref:ABC transporter substrate-binding protein n=1 Tax=Paenibacillus alginolyticus TaxID=59839 RepID=A0ABT4G8A4_9BACL|nr:ABC transporter substrate-binding protein [Paenibacillus alginolyticus]MCY9692397.1 ABC transporter substrate-binding protein [Paenibacillus alginolyticus]MEC0143630.1 ABC transporter substrate-binding protein [Paenibacillus alginolyticus]
MKKWLTGISLAAVSSMIVISGCGNPANNASPSPSTPAASAAATAAPKSAEPVTITLNGWGSSPEETALFQQVLKDFQAKHPNITVKFDVIADQYMDVIKTRLVGGEGADVFFLDAFEAPGLIAKNVLEPLDGYVKPEFDVADFEAPLLNAFKGKDGKSYGFPKDTSTLALFYNKKDFAEAGITKVPTTWEELQDAAKKLTKADGGKVSRFGFGAAPELARQMFMIQAAGGKVSDDNGNAAYSSPEALKGLQPVVDMHLKDKSAGEPKDLGAGWGGEMFGQHKASMVIEGNWAIPYLQSTFKDLDFATAELPTTFGKKATMAYTVAYVMNKSSKHKQEAYELISYLTGKEGMKTWTSKGLALPARKSVAKELGFDKDPLRAALVAGNSYSIPWQAKETLPIIMNNFNNQFISAYQGKVTLEEALKKAQDTANKEIAASK